MIQQFEHISEDIKTLNVTSTAFENGAIIPLKYTCDGENINPPLLIKNIPHETKSLVLVVEDPDAPIRTWVHWLVWNISPVNKINEKSSIGVKGKNDFGKRQYTGPCPPAGTHRYFFKVYALDDLLTMKADATKIDVEKAMSSHIIGFGELIGTYTKKA